MYLFLLDCNLSFSEVFAFGTIWGGPDKDLAFVLVGWLGRLDYLTMGCTVMTRFFLLALSSFSFSNSAFLFFSASSSCSLICSLSPTGSSGLNLTQSPRKFSPSFKSLGNSVVHLPFRVIK